MSKKSLVQIGIALVVVVSMLLVVNGVSLAQGGGRGGQGGQGGGRGQGGYGQQGGMPGGCGMQAGCGQGGYAQGNMFGNGLCCTNLPAAVPGEVPADVIDALNAGLQDEYNAYAVYQAAIDQFGSVRPFVNIQRAEANHIASLEFLFERYNLTIPEPVSAAAPEFATVAEACAAGVEAESANFELYDQWLATVQNYPDMVQIFTNLRDASEFQHLPALELCAG